MFRILILITVFIFFKINIHAQIPEDKKKSYAFQDSLFNQLPQLNNINDLELSELTPSFEIDFLLNKMDITKIKRSGEVNQNSFDYEIEDQFYSRSPFIRGTAISQIGLSENPKMIPLLFTVLDSIAFFSNDYNTFGDSSFEIIRSVKGITHPSAIPFLKKYLVTISNDSKNRTKLKEEVLTTIEFITFFNTSSKEDIFNQLIKNPNNPRWIFSKIIRTNDKDYLPFLQKFMIQNEYNESTKFNVLTVRLKLEDSTISKEEFLFYLLYRRYQKSKRKKVKRKYK